MISLMTTIASYLLAGLNPPGAVGHRRLPWRRPLVGLANGLLIGKLKIPDLVATLATFSVVPGLALIVARRRAAFSAALGTRADARDYVPLVFLVTAAAAALFDTCCCAAGPARASMRSRRAGCRPGRRYFAGSVRIAAYTFCGLGRRSPGSSSGAHRLRRSAGRNQLYACLGHRGRGRRNAFGGPGTARHRARRGAHHADPERAHPVAGLGLLAKCLDGRADARGGEHLRAQRGSRGKLCSRWIDRRTSRGKAMTDPRSPSLPRQARRGAGLGRSRAGALLGRHRAIVGCSGSPVAPAA